MAGESVQHPPDHYLGIVTHLNRDGIIPEIVAGQAVNIWASLYADWDSQYSPLLPKLKAFQPYVSGDLEVVSSVGPSLRQSDNFLSEERRDPFAKAWSPDRATLYLEDAAHGRLKIQVMSSLLGLRQEEVAARMVTLEIHPGTVVKVLDPIALLKAKAANLIVIDQSGRQDLRHLQMLLRCVRAFIGIRFQDGVRFRDILKLVNRVSDFSQSSNARRIAKRYAIRWNDCVPLDIFRSAASPTADPALIRFLSDFVSRWKTILEGEP